MDNDQTVFQGSSYKIPQAPQAVPSENLPLASEPVLQEAPPEVPRQDFQNIQQSVGAPPPPPPSREVNAPPVLEGVEDDYFRGNAFSMVKKAVKIAIGLIVVLLVFSLIFFVILPGFSKNSPKQVTLTYWGLWEDSSVMQGIISNFERQNPNIKIDYSKQDVKQYRQRLVTRINNGTGPDIFRFHNSWTPMLLGGLLALPSDTISKDDFNKYFYPVAQKDLIRNGAIYGIPLEIDVLSLFVNNQLLKSAGLQAPTTWNDFIDTARTITVKDADGKIKTAGAAIGTYGNVNHAPDILSLLFLQNGVNLDNLNNSSDRVESALNFYTSFATNQNNVWDDTLDPSILAFSKGDLGMYFGYSWDYYTIKQAAGPDLDFSIVPVPQLSNQHIALASYWAEGISAKSKYPKEALLFMKYLAQKDTETNFYAETAGSRAFGEPYARVDLADTLKTNKIIYPVVSQAPDASSSFMVDGTYDDGLNQQSDTYLENAVNSILDNGSPQSAFNTFSQGISQVLQKYGQ
jgi:multiple sugar transport system substrate-binding protein